MKLQEYEVIINSINQNRSKCPRQVFSDILKIYGDKFPYDTLLSIFLSDLQRKVKRKYRSKTRQDQVEFYYEQYLNRIKNAQIDPFHPKTPETLSQGDENLFQSEEKENVQMKGHPNVSTKNQELEKNMAQMNISGLKGENSEILPKEETKIEGLDVPVSMPVVINIANENGLPPFLMARFIVEQYLIRSGNTSDKTVNKMTKQTTSQSTAAPTTRNVGDDTVGETMQAANFENGESQNIKTELKRLQLTSVADEAVLPTGEEKHQGISCATGTTPKHVQSSSAINTISRKPIDCNERDKFDSEKQNVETTEGKAEGKESDGKKDNKTDLGMSTKNQLSALMKNPHQIQDVMLREQVLQCMSYDLCYGPINDAIRHAVGVEHEEKLITCVRKHKLPFLDENDLRKRGYDKTPDVKLEVPIAVEGSPVCWIESKASFGDLETHGQYLRDQYYSYWNRFGPGLVIYWFGFVEKIADDMKRQGILVMDHFPIDDKITFMNP